MRVLILTQYYPPETGAPQNRLSSLAKNLKAFGVHVEVLTAMPSYPKSEIFPAYVNKKYVTERLDNIIIHRANLFVSKKSSVSHRLANYFSFSYNSFICASKKLRPFDVIICESPPLFLGITAVFLKRKWKCKLIFNVSDLWPESAEKMGIIKNKTAIKYSYKLANWIYSHADLISGQTQGIVEAIKKMQPSKKLLWFPNGVDVEKFCGVVSLPPADKFILTYAGIIGHAQGLEVILHAANKLKHLPRIEFKIIGDGPEKNKLQQLKEQLQLHNVTFIANKPVKEVICEVSRSNAYVVPLRKLDLFKGAIPSKIFEPLALGVPVLLGVEGEAKNLFIDQADSGLFFEPENATMLAEKIVELYHDKQLCRKLGENGKRFITTNFRRDVIAENFYESIKSL